MAVARSLFEVAMLRDVWVHPISLSIKAHAVVTDADLEVFKHLDLAAQRARVTIPDEWSDEAQRFIKLVLLVLRFSDLNQVGCLGLHGDP